MISLIVGTKGSGKTKKLIDEVAKRLENSDGNVVCLEEKTKLNTEISNKVRLLAGLDYQLTNYEELYGFLSGICATDADTTDILVDQTLKIAGDDKEKLATFVDKAKELSEACDTNLVFTLSADKEELPESIFEGTEII